MNLGDISWPALSDANVTVNATGGLGIDRGRVSLAKWVQRCIATEPGDMIHRPSFGVGVTGVIDAPLTTAAPILTSRIKSRIGADRRVREVFVTTSLPAPVGASARVSVAVRIIEVNDPDPLIVTTQVGP